MRLFPMIALMTATLCISTPVFAQDTATLRTITVNGEGEVSVVPDMATVRIAVQIDADEAAVAMDQASEATAAILATLDTQGVDARDIQTGAVRLTPRYASSVLSSGRQIVGYQAVNSVTVQVTVLDDLGGLLAALVGDGANRLDGVTFGLQDPMAALDEARRRAVAEGARRAQLYADAASVDLGDLITLNENGTSGVQPLRAEPVMMEMAASSPQFDVPVSAGEIDINARVTMIFEIGG